MQARQEKKLTQAQLAQVLFSLSLLCVKLVIWPTFGTHSLCSMQLINEKPQIIQEYESGKAIPNQQIISKLERALGAKLRGKK